MQGRRSSVASVLCFVANGSENRFVTAVKIHKKTSCEFEMITFIFFY